MIKRKFIPAAIDLVAGIVILYNPVLPEIAKVFGLVMLAKGVSLLWNSLTPTKRKYQGWGDYLR